MSNDERRTIDDLAALYLFEPTLRNDVIVEGVQDRRILSWYFAEINVANRAVYTIEEIDVPAGVVSAYGLDPGSNRSRVIALARELYARNSTEAVPRFVIDRDLECVVPTGVDLNGLYLTDLGTMDLYLYHEHAFRKLVKLNCKSCPEDLVRESKLLVGMAHEIFLVRVALRRLSVGAKMLDPSAELSLQHGSPSFSAPQYLRRVLNASNKSDYFNSVLQELAAVRDACIATGCDHWMLANGHDLHHVVVWYLRQLGARTVKNPDNVRELLLMSLTPGVVRKFDLFKNLA